MINENKEKRQIKKMNTEVVNQPVIINVQIDKSVDSLKIPNHSYWVKRNEIYELSNTGVEII